MVINQVSEIPKMGNKCHGYSKTWRGGVEGEDGVIRRDCRNVQATMI